MTHLVAPVMGTTVTVDVRDPGVGDTVVRAALGILTAIEDRFTTFREESAVARIGRGQLRVEDAPDDVREVLQACAVLRAESDGAFDAWRGGRLDPSGYVKGWAGDRAADVLRAGGATAFAVNLGGDVVCGDGPSAGVPWRIGIRDPDDDRRVLLVLGVEHGAVATSGLYERGGHVAHGRTGDVPAAWRSISVLAPDLATADAVATAALAMDADGPAWAASRFGCEVAALDARGRLWVSRGIQARRLA